MLLIATFDRQSPKIAFRIITMQMDFLLYRRLLWLSNFQLLAEFKQTQKLAPPTASCLLFPGFPQVGSSSITQAFHFLMKELTADIAIHLKLAPFKKAPPPPH